jgi:haloacetate dehalogenase
MSAAGASVNLRLAMMKPRERSNPPTSADIRTDETTIFVSRSGSGPPLLLLHGFPETQLMWRNVAPLLARDFTVVCADLRGYGRSGCPASDQDHGPYAKRAMARDMVFVMERLGFPRFSVAGHDRGGRVAYRLALDHPERVERLAALDILPTETVWARADARFALGYWPWSLLAQPEPLPERILTDSAEAVVDDALAQWGSPSMAFPPDVRADYIEALRHPDHAHAICEEYRAGAGMDREHDRADRAAGRMIVCPVLALWSAPGSLGTWYEEESGPVALWREWCVDVHGESLDAGHFFPEEAPEATADALRRFFALGGRRRRGGGELGIT